METPEAVKNLLSGASADFIAEHPDIKLLLQDEAIADYLRETPPEAKPVLRPSKQKKVCLMAENYIP